MKRFPPWLTLLILAPLLGEIVSGHQPPAELCNPLSVVLLMLPYGLGALLCRELVRRWRKGWPSLLLLAIAFGLYEEGIVVRSFFDPNWLELDVLAQHTYVLGVNWIYSIMLVHFHVIVSIGASVLLAEVLHADRRSEPWLGNRGLIAVAAGLALWFPAGWLMTPYVPPAAGYALTFAAIAALILAAWRIPPAWFAPAPGPAPRPFWFFLLVFLNMTAFFLIAFLLPETWIPPLAPWCIGLALLDAVSLALLIRLSGSGGAWTDRHRLAAVIGALGFFLLFNVFNDFEEFACRSGVSLVAAIALAAVWIKVKHRQPSAESPAAYAIDSSPNLPAG